MFFGWYVWGWKDDWDIELMEVERGEALLKYKTVSDADQSAQVIWRLPPHLNASVACTSLKRPLHPPLI